MSKTGSNSASVRLASTVEVGGRIRTSDGKAYRVLGKSVTSSSTAFRMVAEGEKPFTVTADALASMQPVGRPVEKFARMTRLAYNADFDDYINGAIRAAGYPTDPSMRWAGWLNKVFVKPLYNMTKDLDLIDEGIHAMIVHELYEKRILEPDSTSAHFDPDNAALEGKDLANKVSAYLCFVFKGRVGWVRNLIGKELGALTQYDAAGFSLPESLINVEENAKGEEQTVNRGDLGASGKGVNNLELEHNESLAEVKKFCDAFIKALGKMERLNDSYRLALGLITRLIAEGNTLPEVKEELLNSGIESPRGGELNEGHWKTIKRLWVDLIRAFAASPKSGFADTPIGKLISAEAENMQKAASKIALSPTNPVPPGAATQATTATPPAAPAPPNPNVQQQEQAAGTQPPMDGDFQKPGAPASTDPQAQEQAQNPEQNQPVPPQGMTKKTIPPEIPGENHMANATVKKSREEIIAGIKARRADRAKAANAAKPVEASSDRKVRNPKYSRLRIISKYKAADAADALAQLVETLAGLAEDLDGLSSTLDLSPELADNATPEEKIASRKGTKFAAAFRLLAEEEPEALAEALQDVYNRLDEVTGDTENFAENLGITLEEPPAVEEADKAESEDKNEEEEKPSSKEAAKVDFRETNCSKCEGKGCPHCGDTGKKKVPYVDPK